MQCVPDWRSLALVLRRLASSDQQQADAGFQRFWHACIAPAGSEDKEIALQAILTATMVEPMTCRVPHLAVVVSLARSTMLGRNQSTVSDAAANMISSSKYSADPVKQHVSPGMCMTHRDQAARQACQCKRLQGCTSHMNGGRHAVVASVGAFERLAGSGIPMTVLRLTQQVKP